MAILEVKNLYKSFGRVEVLKGIDFSMEEGEIVSIIGSSGSGKTTLLRCLNALEVPTRGEIVIGGEVVFNKNKAEKISREEMRRWQLSCGLVFQSFNLFPQYTALENVSLAPKLLAKDRADYRANKKQILAGIEEEAKALLERVGLGDKIKNYPCELSGGQQQRVAIARALALSPKVLFFDEPTSALDPQLTQEVLTVIRELARTNMTMVIVTHEMKFAHSVSDRVIFMADGIIEEQGKPDAVFGNPQSEKLRAFLGDMEA